MHVADQRHGLDVVASLRAEGVTEPDVLLAGLLHDAGKGQIGRLAARRVVARGALRGVGLAGRRASCPGFAAALAVLRDHAETLGRPRGGGRLLRRDGRA